MHSSKAVTCGQLFILAAFLIATLGLIGSLYISEILHIPVCHLCWYQRICIYPLPVILGLGIYRNDNNAARYCIPLSAIGGCIALYQYLQQMIPGFAPIELCGLGVRCDTIHIKLLGFITLPFISMLGCITITVLLALAVRNKN